MSDAENTLEGMDWLKAELEDALDEDYELEISEPALSIELRRIYKRKHPPTIPRPEYFKALLTLQAELIKLQDWVEHTGEKLAVIFEGSVMMETEAGSPGSATPSQLAFPSCGFVTEQPWPKKSPT